MSEPVDIIITTLRRTRVYSDGEHVMLDKAIESIEATCAPGTYRIHIADDPAERWLPAVNRLMLETEGDVVNFDDDNYALTPGWIERFQAAKERLPRAAILGGKLSFPVWAEDLSDADSYSAGHLQSAGADLLPGGGSCFPHFNAPDPGCYDHPAEACYVCFAGAFVNREFIREAGGLDLGMLAGGYAEDVEYALRAWQAGWRVWYVPGIHFLHYGTQTKRETGETEQSSANWDYLLGKFGHPFYEHIRRDKRSLAPR